MMRTFIGVNISLGAPINKSILKFQNRFVFEEEVWHYEAIKKEIYRNCKVELIDFNDEIFRKTEEIVLQNLYEMWTLWKTTGKYSYTKPIKKEGFNQNGNP